VSFGCIVGDEKILVKALESHKTLNLILKDDLHHIYVAQFLHLKKFIQW